MKAEMLHVLFSATSHVLTTNCVVVIWHFEIQAKIVQISDSFWHLSRWFKPVSHLSQRFVVLLTVTVTEIPVM